MTLILEHPVYLTGCLVSNSIGIHQTQTFKSCFYVYHSLKELHWYQSLSSCKATCINMNLVLHYRIILEENKEVILEALCSI